MAKSKVFQLLVMLSLMIYFSSISFQNLCFAADIVEFKGKTWQQSDDGKAYTWTQANEYCESLELGGYTDWHLPTIKDLRSLYLCTPIHLPPDQIKQGGDGGCKEDRVKKRATRIDSKFNMRNASAGDYSVYWAIESKKLTVKPSMGEVGKSREEVQYGYFSFHSGGVLMGMGYNMSEFVSGNKKHYARCVR